MFSFKQLEAVYWIQHEGSFAGAAQRLHTTQAAISKRVKELELLLGDAVFDRSRRQARLTEKGQQVLQAAQRLLAERDTVMESLVRPEAMVRHIRIGITELVAMTWLPALLARVRAQYPQVTIEPEVDSGLRLRDKLDADRLDLAILPDAFSHDALACLRLDRVPFTWMCRTGLVPGGRRLSPQALAAHTLLMQGDTSGLGRIVARWLDQNLAGSVRPPVVTNSLLPLIGLTIAGMGVSYLPRDCMAPWVADGTLQHLDIAVPEPAVSYVAVYKPELRSLAVSAICELAQQSCDFSQLFRGG